MAGLSGSVSTPWPSAMETHCDTAHTVLPVLPVADFNIAQTAEGHGLCASHRFAMYGLAVQDCEESDTFDRGEAMPKTNRGSLPIPARAKSWNVSVELTTVQFFDANGRTIPLCDHGRTGCTACTDRRRTLRASPSRPLRTFSRAGSAGRRMLA